MVTDNTINFLVSITIHCRGLSWMTINIWTSIMSQVLFLGVRHSSNFPCAAIAVLSHTACAPQSVKESARCQGSRVNKSGNRPTVDANCRWVGNERTGWAQTAECARELKLRAIYYLQYSFSIWKANVIRGPIYHFD